MTTNLVSNGQSAKGGDLILPFWKGSDLDKQLGQTAAALGLDAKLLQRSFKAEHKERFVLLAEGRRCILLGLGDTAGYREVREAFRSLSFELRASLSEQVELSADRLGGSADWIEAAANGLFLGAYDIGLYKSADKSAHPFDGEGAELQLDGADEALLAAARQGQTLAQVQRRILDLMNAPGNKATPQMLAEWAEASAAAHGYSATVLDKAAIEALGLHALLAVNRGSEWEPRFIICEYKHPAATRKVGLVGKGVTFDTGGISIKPSANLHYMKSDMGGAAAVLGTLEAAARLALPVHLVGIVPSTDNCVDATAIKPGDVIGSYSGKTIEVIDTDAEGRLILADAVSYMLKHHAPDVLIDLATLTGSVVRTLGYEAAGLFTHDDALAQAFAECGERTGERVWRLPLWKAYDGDLKSDVADVRNFSGKPTAGAINGAKFIEFFTEQHPHWVHLDIAGVAFGDSEYSKMKSGTAYGIKLLTTWLLTQNPDA